MAQGTDWPQRHLAGKLLEPGLGGWRWSAGLRTPSGNLFLRSKMALRSDTQRNSIFLMTIQICDFGQVGTVMPR